MQVPSSRYRLQVVLLDRGKTDDMRRQNDEGLILLNLVAVVREKISEQRKLGKTGDSVDDFRLRALDQPSQHAHFAILESYIVLDFFAADNGLVDSSDAVGARNLRDLDRQLHADIAIGMHAWRYLDIHADVNVLKLRIYQRIDHAGAGADTHADARLKASRCDRNARSDFERGLLGVPYSDLGALVD